MKSTLLIVSSKLLFLISYWLGFLPTAVQHSTLNKIYVTERDLGERSEKKTEGKRPGKKIEEEKEAISGANCEANNCDFRLFNNLVYPLFFDLQIIHSKLSSFCTEMETVHVDYYECMQCKFFLPKQNFDYFTHSCFADIDVSKEGLYVNKSNQLFKLKINTQMQEAEENEIASTAKKRRGKEDKNWFDSDEILIEAVRNRPCLWNHMIPVKRRSSLNIKDAWEEVRNELNNNFKIEEIKKRWRNLRDCFMKAKRKNAAYIPSGSAAQSLEKSKDGFRLYEQMTFLNDCINTRPSTSNVSDHVDDSHANDGILLDENLEDASCSMSIVNDDTNSTTLESGVNRSDNGCRGTKRRKDLSTDGSFQKDLLKISHTNKPPDGIDGFLLQLGDILRRLPYKNRRVIQNKILNDVFQAEEEAGLL
ncbi:uncharacterized protein [Temnothorax nylanderi]|uniref:uncharacterized protein n=1 Tax=Temnothorax nylanderi TaxID=102681 RepID=UPI003A858C6F